jgi:hypothetical protein
MMMMPDAPPGLIVESANYFPDASEVQLSLNWGESTPNGQFVTLCTVWRRNHTRTTSSTGMTVTNPFSSGSKRLLGFAWGDLYVRQTGQDQACLSQQHAFEKVCDYERQGI